MGSAARQMWLLGLLVGAVVAWTPGTAAAAFPGENGRIAFTRYTDSGGDIYTVNPDGSGLQQLTSTGDNSEPAWSPNGRRIAFTTMRDGNPEIYLMDAGGGNQTRLTADPGRDTHPAWSPDGDEIVFEHLTPGVGLSVHVMGADGSGARAVAGGSDPVWSPDGRRIAYVRGNNIALVDPSGAGLVELTHYPVPTRDSHINSYDPNWSPDGGLIAFWRIGGNGPQFFYELRVIRSDGSAEATVYLGGYNGEGTWSPDGRQMVVQGYGSLELIDVGAWDFVHLPPTAAVPGTAFRDAEPDWQPLVREPQRGDHKNASKYCAALRSFLGEADFSARYASHGACVSSSNRAR